MVSSKDTLKYFRPTPIATVPNICCFNTSTNANNQFVVNLLLIVCYGHLEAHKCVRYAYTEQNEKAQDPWGTSSPAP